MTIVYEGLRREHALFEGVFPFPFNLPLLVCSQ